LAVGRTLVAVFGKLSNEDGSVTVSPDVFIALHGWIKSVFEKKAVSWIF